MADGAKNDQTPAKAVGNSGPDDSALHGPGTVPGASTAATGAVSSSVGVGKAQQRGGGGRGFQGVRGGRGANRGGQGFGNFVSRGGGGRGGFQGGRGGHDGFEGRGGLFVLDFAKKEGGCYEDTIVQNSFEKTFFDSAADLTCYRLMVSGIFDLLEEYKIRNALK